MMLAAYVLGWLLIFKIFGDTRKAYSYVGGKHGLMNYTYGYFRLQGQHKIAKIIEPIFQPINSFSDRMSFEEDGKIDKWFNGLLKAGKVNNNDTYRIYAQNMKLYIERYSLFGFTPYESYK